MPLRNTRLILPVYASGAVSGDVLASGEVVYLEEYAAPFYSDGINGLTQLKDWHTKMKMFDQSENAGVETDDAELFFIANPSKLYEFEAVILFESTSLTNGLYLSVNGPASPIKAAFKIEIPISATASVMRNAKAYEEYAQGTDVPVVDIPYMATIKGVIDNGSNIGNVIVRFRSEASPQTVTIKAGSFIKYRETPSPFIGV